MTHTHIKATALRIGDVVDYYGLQRVTRIGYVSCYRDMPECATGEHRWWAEFTPVNAEAKRTSYPYPWNVACCLHYETTFALVNATD